MAPRSIRFLPTVLACWQKVSSDFLRKVAETFGTRLLLIAISLFTGVIVARTLGPEGRGLYATAMTIGVIGVQFGNLGLHASNTYYVAQDHKLLGSLTGNSLLVSFVFGGGCVVVAWVIFTIWPNLAPVQGLLLGLALLGVPFALAYLLLQNLLLGIQEVRAYNTIELITKLLAVALIGFIIWLQAISPMMVLLASSLSSLIGLIWVSRRLKRQIGEAVSASFLLFQQGIRYGFKAYLAAFFAYMVLRIDLLMVKQMLGAEQAGYYSVAASTADLVFLLPSVIGMLLFPRLSAITNQQEKYQLMVQTTRLTGVGMFVLVLLASVLAKPAIQILYGEEFLPAVYAFIWLMPGILFLGIQVVSVQYLNSIGFPRSVVVAWGITLILNVALNIWAIPLYGLIGASIASSISYCLVFVLIIFVIYRCK